MMPTFWIYDGRHRADPDAAAVLDIEHSLGKAKRSARSFGDAVAVRMKHVGNSVYEDDEVVFDTSVSSAVPSREGGPE